MTWGVCGLIIIIYHCLLTNFDIRFAVKSEENAHILLSGKLANNIIYNTDYDYIEVVIGGGSGNSKSTIRVSTLGGWAIEDDTPGILDSLAYKYFWLSWESSSGNNGTFKVGHGFEINQNVFMERNYDPLVIDIKYLALLSVWGSGGDWRLYAGILSIIPKL